jgi:hypothetical protein
MEEDPRCIRRDDASGVATDERGGGEAAASSSSSREEAGTASARGLHARGSEATWQATHSDGYETPACTDCATTGCRQAQWSRSRSNGSGSCRELLFCSFYCST